MKSSKDIEKAPTIFWMEGAFLMLESGRVGIFNRQTETSRFLKFFQNELGLV